MRIFLGGTYTSSNWREKLISQLETNNYFNPVVDNWTIEAKQKEIIEKELCNIHLYVITSDSHSLFSIAEAVESVMSNKLTIFCVMPQDFDEQKLNSLSSIADIIKRNGGIALRTHTISEISLLLNLITSNE